MKKKYIILLFLLLILPTLPIIYFSGVSDQDKFEKFCLEDFPREIYSFDSFYSPTFSDSNHIVSCYVYMANIKMMAETDDYTWHFQTSLPMIEKYDELLLLNIDLEKVSVDYLIDIVNMEDKEERHERERLYKLEHEIEENKNNNGWVRDQTYGEFNKAFNEYEEALQEYREKNK